MTESSKKMTESSKKIKDLVSQKPLYYRLADATNNIEPDQFVVRIDKKEGCSSFRIINKNEYLTRQYCSRLRDCSFHEVFIADTPKNIYFDYDMQIEEHDHSNKYLLERNVIKATLRGIKDYIRRFYDIEPKIIIYTSSDHINKISLHFLVKDIHLTSGVAIKRLCGDIIRSFPPNISSCFDMMVYGNNRSLRLLGSGKPTKDGSNRTKVIYRYETVEDIKNDKDLAKCVDDFKNHKFSPDEFVNSLIQNVDVEKSTKVDYSSRNDDEVATLDDGADSLLGLVSNLEKKAGNEDYDHPSGGGHEHIKSTQYDGYVKHNFKRLNESYCLVCNRTHKSENMFIIENENGNTKLYCYRAIEANRAQQVGFGKANKSYKLIKRARPEKPLPLSSNDKEEQQELELEENCLFDDFEEPKEDIVLCSVVGTKTHHFDDFEEVEVY
jgi:hypothetical protein